MQTNTIDFYVFSGTGNTMLVAKEMIQYFEENEIDVNLHHLEKSDPATINLKHTIGLAFPVAIQATYPFVWDFIEKLPQASGTEVFMVDTMGGYSGGIVGPLGKLLKKKGYSLLAAKEIVMPSNFFTKHSEQKQKKTIHAGLRKARIFAHDIHFRVASWPRPMPHEFLMNKINRSEKPWKFMRKKVPFKIETSKCIQCGICYRLCPADNIRMYEFPEFQDQCVLCLRCYNYCPSDAISAPPKMKKYKAVSVSDLLHNNKTASEPENHTDNTKGLEEK